MEGLIKEIIPHGDYKTHDPRDQDGKGPMPFHRIQPGIGEEGKLYLLIQEQVLKAFRGQVSEEYLSIGLSKTVGKPEFILDVHVKFNNSRLSAFEKLCIAFYELLNRKGPKLLGGFEEERLRRNTTLSLLADAIDDIQESKGHTYDQLLPELQGLVSQYDNALRNADDTCSRLWNLSECRLRDDADCECLMCGLTNLNVPEDIHISGNLSLLTCMPASPLLLPGSLTGEQMKIASLVSNLVRGVSIDRTIHWAISFAPNYLLGGNSVVESLVFGRGKECSEVCGHDFTMACGCDQRRMRTTGGDAQVMLEVIKQNTPVHECLGRQHFNIATMLHTFIPAWKMVVWLEPRRAKGFYASFAKSRQSDPTVWGDTQEKASSKTYSQVLLLRLTALEILKRVTDAVYNLSFSDSQLSELERDEMHEEMLTEFAEMTTKCPSNRLLSVWSVLETLEVAHHRSDFSVQEDIIVEIYHVTVMHTDTCEKSDRDQAYLSRKYDRYSAFWDPNHREESEHSSVIPNHLASPDLFARREIAEDGRIGTFKIGKPSTKLVPVTVPRATTRFFHIEHDGQKITLQAGSGMVNLKYRSAKEVTIRHVSRLTSLGFAGFSISRDAAPNERNATDASILNAVLEGVYGGKAALWLLAKILYGDLIVHKDSRTACYNQLAKTGEDPTLPVLNAYLGVNVLRGQPVVVCGDRVYITLESTGGIFRLTRTAGRIAHMQHAGLRHEDLLDGEYGILRSNVAVGFE